MERMRKLSLKRAFFLLAFGCTLLSLLLALAIWQVCQVISSGYPHGGIAISVEGAVSFLEAPTPGQSRVLAVLTGIQVGALLLLPVCGLAVAAGLFYHFKLKPPIHALKMGTEQIQNHNLDFTLPEASGDELGEICDAFETMRRELLETNRELWYQAKEQKRLNAAFSHDIRNPITVLKGTVRLLRQGRADEQALERLESYTLRLEQYVEAMSGIQRLEQLPVKRKLVTFMQLKEDLAETAVLLAPALKLTLEVSETGEAGIMIDHGIFLTVAENLIGNAARFSKDRLFLTLKRQAEYLLLTVGDNGDGFPRELAENGPRPFWRLESDREKERAAQEDEIRGGIHFGMGLYSCELLCRKHGGALRLENVRGQGGAATAVFGVGREAAKQ